MSDIIFTEIQQLTKIIGPIAMLDLESTTFRGKPNFAITEVCCGLIGPENANVDVYTTLVNPEQPIDAAVVSLTGISPKMVATAPTWGKSGGPLFQKLAKTHLFSGFNIKTFDCPAIEDMGKKYKVPVGPLKGILDIRYLHKELSGATSLKGKLLDIAQWYGVYSSDTLHRAEADVMLTFGILSAMCALYGVEEVAEAAMKLISK